MFPESLINAAHYLLKTCEQHKIMLATAESCTGGLIAALLTEIPGSSAVFERGFVTYSNYAKTSLLGVSEALLAEHGAVSREVAGAMAQGVLANSMAGFSISVTGIAGPDGGTPEKPVGLVYIGVACAGNAPIVEECRFTGTRSEIRLATVARALALAQTTITHS